MNLDGEMNENPHFLNALDMFQSDFFCPSVYHPKQKTEVRTIDQPVTFHSSPKVASSNDIFLNFQGDETAIFVPKHLLSQAEFRNEINNTNTRQFSSLNRTDCKDQNHQYDTMSLQQDYLALSTEIKKLEEEDRKAENQYKNRFNQISNEKNDLIRTVKNLENRLQANEAIIGIDQLENDCQDCFSAMNDSLIDSLNSIINYQSTKIQSIRKVNDINHSLKTGKAIKYLNQVDEFVNSLFV